MSMARRSHVVRGATRRTPTLHRVRGDGPLLARRHRRLAPKDPESRVFTSWPVRARWRTEGLRRPCTCAAPIGAVRSKRLVIRRSPTHCRRPHLAVEPVAELVGDHVNVDIRLEPQPELRRRVEGTTEPKCRIGAHATLAQHDLVDAACRHAEIQREAILAEAEWLQELQLERLTRVYG